jgi:kynurenine 3-monooxygenase
MAGKQKTIVVGAGPVGSLAALYAAQRGHDVELYELRDDLRDPSTTPLNFTKSINLALSERGINAMRHAGDPALLDHVMAATIPMRGRMIHGKLSNGDLFEQPQDYDVHGRVGTRQPVQTASCPFLTLLTNCRPYSPWTVAD